MHLLSGIEKVFRRGKSKEQDEYLNTVTSKGTGDLSYLADFDCRRYPSIPIE